MSIKHGLLALLAPGPKYGYQLKAEFEAATGSAWPLNIGQVYSTLQRLEKGGQIEADGVPDDDGRVVYALTPAGRAELTGWFGSPIAQESRPRDELAIKLAMAVSTPGIDARAVVQAQRHQAMSSLQSLTRLKATVPDEDLARVMVIDSLIFAVEAEVSWLDRCESRLRKARPVQTPEKEAVQ
ncbi:PadR family transcriptional regulator [Nocardioides sp. BYT-33-1]|uniref:PadR family transcriptional regulator n=1 Tax=Nocardioides sp. BYT-33-1 TaxID=3416952 RepID=UPI003F52E0EE